MSRPDLLPSAIVRHNELKAELLSRFASLQDDPEALADTAEGVGSNLSDLLKRVVWSIRKIARDKADITDRLADLGSRKKALCEREERLRALVAHGMAEGGIETLTDVEWSAGLSKTAPKLVIADEEALPEEFYHIDLVPRLIIHNGEIRKALEARQEVPGAHLSNGGQTLTIRPKRARKDAE